MFKLLVALLMLASIGVSAQAQEVERPRRPQALAPT
jgi:hypothetical protein